MQIYCIRNKLDNFAHKKEINMKLVKFVKDWILIFSILAGIGGYFIYTNIPFLDGTHTFVNNLISIVQPLLIFAMLFLTFSRVSPKKLRLCKYHWWLLLFQAGMFLMLSAVLIMLPHSGIRVVLEAGMICFICPTATAGAVITRKLGGNASHIVTYTILINLVTSLMIPAVVPFVHPNPSMSVWNAFFLILGKVFPLLLLPLITAFLIRRLLPRLHFVISHYHGLSFDLWVVALALATAVTVRYIVHSDVSFATALGIVIISLFSCVIQFYVGRKIGVRYHDMITGGQSLGQKNTVLAIWMGYTFFTPITSVAGGFYSIWHNVINSWQLYEHNKKQAAKNSFPAHHH